MNMRMVMSSGLLAAKNKLKTGLLLLLVLGTSAGCGGVMLDATDNQPRTMEATPDGSRTITLKDSMVWYNDTSRRLGVKLPQGIYAIEGEDKDFWYFRAPHPMDFRKNDRTDGDNERYIQGGIALRKNFDLMVPAEVYIDGEPGDGKKKDLILKLGAVFAQKEGSVWIRNF